MDKYAEYKKKRLSKNRIVDESKSIMVEGNSIKGPITYAEYKRDRMGIDKTGFQSPYDKDRIFNSSIKRPDLALIKSAMDRVDSIQNSQQRESERLSRELKTTAERSAISNPYDEPMRKTLPESVTSFLKRNPNFRVNGEFVESDKAQYSFRQLEDEYQHIQNNANKEKKIFTTKPGESIIVGSLDQLPKDTREYNPYDTGLLGGDRGKLKWQLGQLMDQEGLAWEEASRTGDSTKAKQISAQIQDLMNEYPEITEDLKPFKKDPISRLKAFYQSAVESTAEMLPTMINAQKEGAKFGMPSALAAGGAAAIGGQLGPHVLLPEEIITVPGAMALGYKAGSTTGVTNHMYSVEKGHAYNAMINEGVPADIANRWATIVGAANAGIELVQLNTLLKSTKVAGNLGKELADETIQKHLTDKGLKQVAKFIGGVAEETGQEVAQEMVSMTGEIAGKKQAGQDVKVFTKDNLNRLIETASQSAKSFMLLQGAGQIGGSVYRGAMKDMQKPIIQTINELRSDPEILSDQEVVKMVEQLTEEIKQSAEQTNDPFLTDAAQKLVQIQTDYAKSAQISPVLNEGVSKDKSIETGKEVSTGKEKPNVDTSNIQNEIDNEPNVVMTSRFGEVEVVDNDGSIVTIKNSRGTELKIGVAAFEKTVAEAESESVSKPDVPDTNVVKVEQPIEKMDKKESNNEYTVYQGRGKDRAQIYRGTEYPVLGDGQYYAKNPEMAKNYGDDVTEHKIKLNNPLVIKDDADWKKITTNAGWKFSQLMPGLEGNVEQIQALKKTVMDMGYDGIVIDYEQYRNGDINRLTKNPIKVLDNMFSHDQIVVYQQSEKKSKSNDSNKSSEPKAQSTFKDNINRHNEMKSFVESKGYDLGPAIERTGEKRNAVLSKEVDETGNPKVVGYISPEKDFEIVLYNREKAKTVEPTQKVEKKPLEIDYKRTVSAYSGVTHDPEKRAKAIQKDFRNDIDWAREEFSKLAVSDEQKAIMETEMERFEKGLYDKYNKWIDATAKTMNWAITGRGNFPVAKNEKAMALEHKRVTELLSYKENAIKAIKRKITKATPQGVVDETLKKKYIKQADEIISVVDGIKKGELPYNKSLLTNNFKNRLMTLAKGKDNPNLALAKEVLQYVKDNQDPKNKVFADNNAIWNLLDEVQEVKTVKENEVLKKYDGAEVVKDYEADRIRIYFDEKPGDQVIKDLKSSGWRWTPSEGVWQRKITNAAEFSYKKIMDKHFDEVKTEAVKTIEEADVKIAEPQAAEQTSVEIPEAFKNIYTYNAYEPSTTSPTKVVTKDAMKSVKFDTENYSGTLHWVVKKDYITKSIQNRLDKIERTSNYDDQKIEYALLNPTNSRDEINLEPIGFNDKAVIMRDPKSDTMIAVDKNFYEYFRKQGLSFYQYDKVSPVNPVFLTEQDGEIVGLVLPVRIESISGKKSSEMVGLENNYPPKEEANDNKPNLKGFKNAEFEIKLRDSEKGSYIEKVQGITFGDYGLNKNQITHLPTKLAVISANNQTKAKLTMKYLNQNLGEIKLVNDWPELTEAQTETIRKAQDIALWNADELLNNRGSNIKSDEFKTFLDSIKDDGPAKRVVHNYEAWAPEKGINKYKSGKNKKIKPVHEIIGDIKKDFKVGYTTSRYRARKAVAHYKVFPQVIESKIANTIEPIMHELGHHLDYRYNLSELNGIKQMIDKMPDEFKNQYKQHEHAREAIAEFLRLYMTSPGDAYEYGGEFYDLFESRLKMAGDLEKVQSVRNDVMNWLAASTRDQIKSTIISRMGNSNIEGIKKDFKGQLQLLKKKAYMYAFDELLPLVEFVEYVEKATGKKLSKDQNAYLLAQQSLKSTAIAHEITTGRLLDAQNNVIGKSFNSIFKGRIDVSNHKDFEAYLISKRAIDYWNRGKRTFSEDLPIEYVEMVVAEIENQYPEFEKVSNDLYEWWQTFTEEWIVETGLLDPELYEHMKELEPHYVPFFRLRNEQVVIDGAIKSLARRGYADQRNPIKRSSREGSADPIFNPIESMIMEIERYVTTVKRREVMLSIHDIYTEMERSTGRDDKMFFEEGLGSIINKVNPRMAPDTVDMSGKKIKLSLAMYDEFAKTLTGEDAALYKSMREEVASGSRDNIDLIEFLHQRGFNAISVVDEIISDIEMQLKPMDFDKEKNIITVKDRSGNTVHYEVYDRFLLEALLNADNSNIDGVVRTVGTLRRIMQGLITTFNPVFWLRNISRDVAQGFAASDIPMAKYHKELIKAIYQEITNGEWSQKYRQSGGGFASPVGASRNALKESYAETIPGWKRQHPFQAALQKVEQVSDALEQAPRIAEFRYFVEKYGDTYENRLEALYKAQDVTVNFNRKGQVMRSSFANLIPFLNPALQGIDKFARMNTKDIAKTLPRALVGVTLMSIGLYAINRDDPYYEKQSKYIKDNYFMFPTGTPGKWIKVPKPREIGMLYGSVFERALDMAIDKNPEAWDDFFSNFAQVLMPPVQPITSSYSAAKHNKNWYGGDIVPYIYQRLEVDQQYDDRTSWFGKQLAKIIPDSTNFSSPMVIDYLIEQYTGIIGKTLIPATDNIEGNALEYLVSSFTSDIAYSNNVVPKFYDRLNEMESALATIKAGRPVKGYKGLNSKPTFDLVSENMKVLIMLYDEVDNLSDKDFAELKKQVGSDLQIDLSRLDKKSFKRALKLKILDDADKANKVYDQEVKKMNLEKTK